MFAIFGALRKPVGFFRFAILSVILAACVDTGFVGTGPTVNTRNPVSVALLLPYNSGSPGDEAVATNLENAARMAVADLDGVQIDLQVYPTAGGAEGARAAAAKAVSGGAKIILGPLFAEAANAAATTVASRGVSVLAFSNNTDIAGGNLFLLGNTFTNTARRLIDYSASLGKGQVLVAHANNPAGIAGRRAVEAAIAGSNATLVGAMGYEFSQEGIIAAMPTVAEMVKTNGADTIFLTGGVDADLPFVAQLLPENGLPATEYQYLGLTRWDTAPQLFNLEAIRNGWFTLPDPARYEQFIARYTTAYGQRPHPLAGLAYDGIAAIGALIKSGGNDALSRGRLTQRSGFVGVNGTFRFLPDGTNQRALAVATIEENRVRILDPAPSSFRSIGF